MTPSRQYRIILTAHAYHSLKKLRKDKQTLRRIDEAIQSLRSQPRPSGCRKLAGSQFDNTYRIRVGDWRILYSVEDFRVVVLILDFVSRDQAYR